MHTLELELAPELETKLAELKDKVVKVVTPYSSSHIAQFLCTWPTKFSTIPNDRTCLRLVNLLLVYLPAENAIEHADVFLSTLSLRFLCIDIDQKGGQGFMAFVRSTGPIQRTVILTDLIVLIPI